MALCELYDALDIGRMNPKKMDGKETKSPTSDFVVCIEVLRSGPLDPELQINQKRLDKKGGVVSLTKCGNSTSAPYLIEYDTRLRALAGLPPLTSYLPYLQLLESGAGCSAPVFEEAPASAASGKETGLHAICTSSSVAVLTFLFALYCDCHRFSECLTCVSKQPDFLMATRAMKERRSSRTTSHGRLLRRFQEARKSAPQLRHLLAPSAVTTLVGRNLSFQNLNADVCFTKK